MPYIDYLNQSSLQFIVYQPTRIKEGDVSTLKTSTPLTVGTSGLKYLPMQVGAQSE